MESIIILLFVIGYMVIAFEHPLRLNKTVPALLMASLMWMFLAVGFYNGWLDTTDHAQNARNIIEGPVATAAFKESLLFHLAKISEIILFLIGAMTIVELIDLHKGFEVIRTYITTESRAKLLWITGFIAFFLSAVIDNLAATIVMVTILRTLIKETDLRLWYVGMIVIASNAGGAWSPIGDVTTTMLWISEKVTALGLIKYLVLPSVVCFVVPFSIATVFIKPFQGRIKPRTSKDKESKQVLSSQKMLFVGLATIVMVPVIKAVTHVPPYIGMLFALAVVWFVSEYIRPEFDLSKEDRKRYSVKFALHRIEMSSVLFFLGILLAVAALDTMVYAQVDGEKVGTLRYAADTIQRIIPNRELAIVFLGVCSAIVDNVPLVASAIGMFSESIDDSLWHLLAYCAGTGGSMLVIGSAAGVAAMGMENIGFGWYLKNITWLAAVGFFSGVVAFVLLRPLIG